MDIQLTELQRNRLVQLHEQKIASEKASTDLIALILDFNKVTGATHVVVSEDFKTLSISTPPING